MDQMNLMEALHTLYEQPTAVGIRSTVDGWSYVIKRQGEEGFAMHRSKIGSTQPAEDLTFANEGELLEWWSTKRQEPAEADPQRVVEALYEFIGRESAESLETICEGWHYHITREPLQPYQSARHILLRRDRVGSILSEEVHFHNGDQLLWWWANRRQEPFGEEGNHE